MRQADFDYEQVPMSHDRGAGWRYVRERGEVFQAADGMWYLTSPDAITFAAKHPEMFASGPAFAFLGSPVPLVPLGIDPPDHRRFRKVLDPLLAPRVVNALEDRLRAQMAALVDQIADQDGCDVMADIARLYPTSVFLTLFGMPVEDRARFVGWVELVESGGPGDEPLPQVADAAARLFGYLQEWIERKRSDLGDDMLSGILRLDGDDAWSDAEILGMCFLFTLAGLGTVTAAIGFMMYHLARDPALRGRVISDPAAASIFIEEIVRLEPPAPITVRVTTADVDVCGVTIPAGATCQLTWGAANRHPSRGAAADEIDLESPDQGHMGFGSGIHRCVGSHLARRELRLVLEEFHRRIPDYRIAGGHEPTIVFPATTYHFRELPVVFERVLPAPTRRRAATPKTNGPS